MLGNVLIVMVPAALAGKIAFRGGTALHKLLFKQSLRYSEDIDLVQTHPEPIGGTVDAIRAALGRLHREHAGKTDVRIIDFVDTGHPALVRMWDERLRGYRAMGYSIRADVDPAEAVAAGLPLSRALQTRIQQ